jgi:phage/plasmid-associated DNA primase
LSQLLEPEDILTLQEFIGYCFIPSTKGQKMLMLTGKGGKAMDVKVYVKEITRVISV